MLAWLRPAARWPRPDFVARPARAPWAAWAMLVVGALAAALAVDDGLALGERREATRRELGRWQAVRPPAARPAPKASVPPAQIAAAHDVVRQLQHPWHEVLAAIERRPAPGVQWLRLEHDAARGELRLTGVADRREAVTATLESLPRAPGLRDLMLIRIDAGDPPAAASPSGPGVTPVSAIRFELALRVVDAVGAP